MKCDELKAEQWLDYSGEPKPCYPKATVDAAIEELKAEHHKERHEYIKMIAELKQKLFDKWQQMLPEKERVKKPEDLIVDRGPEIDEKDEFRYTINMKCSKCPCIKKCEKEYDNWTGCKDIFLEWAKEEV